jgi:hypothetical protein
MSYEAQLQQIMRFVPPAMNAVFAEYAEAAISWDKQSAVQAIIAKIKLDTPEIRNAVEAYNVVEAALAALLMSRKIGVKSFGYSSLGNEEVNLLFAKYMRPEPPKIVTAQEQYADIIRDYTTLSTYDLCEKKKIPGYLSRFDAAVLAGVI